MKTEVIPADAVKVEETAPTATAIVSLATHLQSAVTQMNADVLSLEVAIDRDSARVKFYAYRNRPTDKAT
jgi:hypothetical protein